MILIANNTFSAKTSVELATGLEGRTQWRYLVIVRAQTDGDGASVLGLQFNGVTDAIYNTINDVIGWNGSTVSESQAMTEIDRVFGGSNYADLQSHMLAKFEIHNMLNIRPCWRGEFVVGKVVDDSMNTGQFAGQWEYDEEITSISLVSTVAASGEYWVFREAIQDAS